MYADGLRLYRAQRWVDAGEVFRRALEIEPADGPSQTLLTRCRAYQQRGPERWDGVHVMSPAEQYDRTSPRM